MQTENRWGLFSCYFVDTQYTHTTSMHTYARSYFLRRVAHRMFGGRRRMQRKKKENLDVIQTILGCSSRCT